MNILKTIRIFGLNDFIVSKMENQVIQAKIQHLTKHQGDFFTFIANALTTTRKGGVRKYSECIENMLTKGEKNIHNYNIVPLEDLKNALYENWDITPQLEYFMDRTHCSIDTARYYYFDGVHPFYAWFVSKLKCVGYVSAKECYDELWRIRRSVEEKTFQHVDN